MAVYITIDFIGNIRYNAIIYYIFLTIMTVDKSNQINKILNKRFTTSRAIT